jgi:WD40 repeat protein/serine/threonine protein kinase
MTRNTGDEPNPTRDERPNADEIDRNVETEILSLTQGAVKTVRLGESGAPIPGAISEFAIGSLKSIGNYRIIRKIGEGGMGVVYEAEQQHPRRLVALKVIRSGPHADEYHVRMFEREIQALARLKHPGIASIYESGRSDDGQIFFAMELIHGTSLLDFVENRWTYDDSIPDVKNQLELFSKICNVISHAHQHGVIHRDLKPQNIMVIDESEARDASDSLTGKVGVKILDFGLARITDPDLGGASDVSQVGQIKGTLLYMSPEQLGGKPNEIDIRSDIYSLGVILYEMLTGQVPFDIGKIPLPEAIRIICDEPVKFPSKVTSDSRSDGRRRSGRIDRDVETIVLKALEKEPERRYQSVSAMMDDIERYLRDQPILARPPSAYYQLRKLVARHKAAFVSLVTIFLLLLGFGIVMAGQSARIALERDKALKAGQEAEEQKNDAELSRKSEQKQRLIAEENLRRAEEQQALAEKAGKSEQEQHLIAEKNLNRSKDEQKRAEEQKTLAERQTSLAQEQKALAEKRKTEADEQKTLAEERSEANRRLLYVSQINLAEQAWEQANITQLDELLENQIPKPGQDDLRGFEWYYLWRLSHRDTLKLPALEGVLNTRFSPDGKILVVGGSDFAKTTPKITLLDASTGKELGTIEGSLFLGFSHDGKLLIQPGKLAQNNNNKEGPIQLWDLKTGQTSSSPLKTSYLFPHIFPEFSADGKLMASPVQEHTVDVFDAITGNKILSLNLNIIPVSHTLTFSPDDRILASSNFGRISFYDLASGKELGSIPTRGVVFAITFSPDSKILAGQIGGNVTLWDVATKQELTSLTSRKESLNYGMILHGLAFSPDGKHLAVTDGRAVRLWDLSRGEEVGFIRGHGDSVRNLAFSPDGTRLVTVSNDGVLKLWSIPIVEATTTLKGQISSALSPDGKTLATADNDGKMKLWDFATGQDMGKFDDEQDKSGLFFFSPKFSPDGKTIAVKRTSKYGWMGETGLMVSREGNPLEIWDVASRKKLGLLDKTIVTFAFSPDGRMLVTTNQNKTVQLWDVATQKMLSSLGTGYFVAFSPDGRTVAVGTPHSIKLVDITTGQELVPELGNPSLHSVATFSPDGKMLSTAFIGSVVLWNIADGKEIGTLKGYTGSIRSCEFSPDGRRLVTTGQDRVVKIWDVAGQKALLAIEPEDLVYSAVFSPDGNALVTNGINSVQIWRGATEKEVLGRRKQ